MLAISVEFLHGTYRATDADDLTLTRQPKLTGEWPPAPARLLAALVAADGTRGRQRVTTGIDDLQALEESAPPTIFASSGDQVASTVLLRRYVVIDKADRNTAQNYPARSSQAISPGAVTAMACPQAIYVWDGVELTTDQLANLRLRCARVGYLGCADSPVRVRVSQHEPTPGPLAPWSPDPRGRATLGVPGPGLIDAFDAAFDRFTAGEATRRSWIPTPLANYRAAAEPQIDPHPTPSLVWLRFDRPISPRRVVLVAATMRAAVLEHLERNLGDRGQVPNVVHGHNHEGEVARWLPLPHVGATHADGRIRGVCIWLPPGTPPWVVAEVADAAASVRRLVRPGVFDVAVFPFDGTPRPWSTNPRRWLRPSRRLGTVFPALYERRVKRDLALEDISQWCVHAGLPAPIAARALPVSPVRGGVQLTPWDVYRRSDQHRPYTHLELIFDVPIPGPAAVGRGRQYGLGLLAPLEEG